MTNLLLTALLVSAGEPRMTLKIEPPVKGYIRLVVQYHGPATNRWRVRITPSTQPDRQENGSQWFGSFWGISSAIDGTHPFRELAWRFPARYGASFFRAELMDEDK
jgi:hypothetical protein